MLGLGLGLGLGVGLGLGLGVGVGVGVGLGLGSANPNLNPNQWGGGLGRAELAFVDGEVRRHLVSPLALCASALPNRC